MRKVLRILVLIPVLYLLIIPALFTSATKAELCGGISIDLKDSSDYHFVTKKHLQNLVNNSRVLGKPLKEISVPEIEGKIKSIKELRDAEVYTAIDGTIHVYAEQRTPVMRVMPSEGGDYFVDEDGVVFRKRNLYNPRLHIVGGNITISQAMNNGVSIFDTTIKYTVLRDVYSLVKYINKDDFWSAQIDQIYVDGNDEIDLLPRAGSHIIHLGTVENLDVKLKNLEQFYDKVLPEVGWNKYSYINLEYKGQIVCRRR
ncbi:MAG TPA: cell division protein FtsQ/DivIB [Bacteroidales bacterium]|nr:cell division protein FtsQ/DivIB [Bacteroidales bacterium]